AGFGASANGSQVPEPCTHGEGNVPEKFTAIPMHVGWPRCPAPAEDRADASATIHLTHDFSDERGPSSAVRALFHALRHAAAVPAAGPLPARLATVSRTSHLAGMETWKHTRAGLRPAGVPRRSCRGIDAFPEGDQCAPGRNLSVAPEARPRSRDRHD